MCDSQNLNDPSDDFMSWRAYVRSPKVSSFVLDRVPTFDHPNHTCNVLWLDGHVTAEAKNGAWMNPDDSYWGKP
jgi:prepilin-type processing-associated H-X9-DG protein